MKKVIDRFAAKDSEGNTHTVLCLKYYTERDPDPDKREMVFETTQGERLYTQDQVSFRIENSSALLRRLDPEMSFPT